MPTTPATAGMAEIAVAGAIPMGLGGYLAARTDRKHYDSEERREFAEVEGLREREVAEGDAIFKQYGLVDPKRAPISAATIGTSYLVVASFPLAPYLLSSHRIPGFCGPNRHGIARLWHRRRPADRHAHSQGQPADGGGLLATAAYYPHLFG